MEEREGKRKRERKGWDGERERERSGQAARIRRQSGVIGQGEDLKNKWTD